MKQMFGLAVLIVFLPSFKCRFAAEPTSKPYGSIAISKKNKAFINEYYLNTTFFSINGKKYYVKEAWIEYSHLERNFQDILTVDTCIVINLNVNENDSTDLKKYIKEMGNGSETIWFNFPNHRSSKDTVVVYYRENIESKKKERTLEFIKKK